MILVAPGATYTQPDEDSQISTLRGSVKTQIVNASWKASFASSDSEFTNILNTMRNTVQGLGIDQVMKVDMQNAKDQNTARVAIAQQYKSN